MARLAPYDCVVVGGGFAGLSTAVHLVREGARVLVLEARSRLGGRATAFHDRSTGELVDNGQHVLLGCYAKTFAFLHAIGASSNVRLQSHLSITMIDRAGVRSRLDCPDLPSPWHLLGGIIEWDALRWSDRLSALRMASVVRLARRALQPGTGVAAASPGETVENWLIRNGQTPRLREMLWEPLALAALNQSPREAAAPLFARVLAEMLAPDPMAAALGLPVVPLHRMYAEPSRSFLEAHGSHVRTGVPAVIDLEDHHAPRVRSGAESWSVRAVVAAVPWHALADCLVNVPASMTAIVSNAQAMRHSPIVTVNLWFDRPVLDQPFIGLPGRAMQWVFDKRAVFGTAASHLSLVSSGASPLGTRTHAELIQQATLELAEALPEAAAAKVVQATVIREPRATFSLAPDQPARPGVKTPVPGLFLAGDWTATGLPATIESAVRSGERAGQAVLGL